ncbi:MAG: ROK family protein [Lentisphaeraceae bacterium]|nr:ROK family protein [Lentisphaeraceae bacterium]
MVAKDKKILRNAALILEELFVRKQSTQVELSKQTPLKRTSIFNIFEDLRSGGFVESVEAITPVKGRPSQLWTLSGDPGVFVAVAFNRIGSDYSIYDFSGKLISHKVGSSCTDIEACLAELKVKLSGIKKRVLGIVICIGGIVDTRMGMVRSSNIWEIKNFPMQLRVRELVQENTLICIENNARAALWGERISHGNLAKNDIMSLLIHKSNSLGSRSFALGSALVLGGDLYQGSNGQAGELEQLYYDYLEENFDEIPHSLSELSDKQIEAFASTLATHFARLVNYLMPQQLMVQLEAEPQQQLFFDFFSSALKYEIKFNCSNVDIILAPLGHRSINEGAVNQLMKMYFNKSSELEVLLEKSSLV